MLYKIRTKILALVILCTILLSSVDIYANTHDTVSSVTSTMSISNHGELSIIYRNVANADKIDKITVTTYIEKKQFGIFWERINIGTINNEWIDTIHDCHYIGSRSFILPSVGIYRTTIIYKFYHSDGLISTITCNGVNVFIN